MGRAPAFQFYPGDWVQDTRMLSLPAKGAWIDLLCAMWRSKIRGTLSMPLIGYARVLGASIDQADAVIHELIDMQICDSVTECNGNVTVVCRRMVREEEQRTQGNERVKRFRNADVKRKCNKNVTLPSSSSSSSSKKKVVKKKCATVVAPAQKTRLKIEKNEKGRIDDQEWLESLKGNQAYTGLDIDICLGKMIAWCETNGKEPTRRRFVNWLNREERPLRPISAGRDESRDMIDLILEGKA